MTDQPIRDDTRTPQCYLCYHTHPLRDGQPQNCRYFDLRGLEGNCFCQGIDYAEIEPDAPSQTRVMYDAIKQAVAQIRLASDHTTWKFYQMVADALEASLPTENAP